MMIKNKKFRIIISVILSLILLYFSVCIALYFFEPVSYDSANLNDAQYAFDLYNKFAKDKNDKFYIKQISQSDIKSAEDDFRLKYVDDTILVIMDESVSYNQAESFFSEHNAVICGYIEVLDMYQIEIDVAVYDELADFCNLLKKNNMVKSAIIDIFEETPSDNESSTESDQFIDYDLYNFYYYSMLGIDKLSIIVDFNEIISDITYGIMDVPVYYKNSSLNVVNRSDYPESVFDSPSFQAVASHGTHVAGIIGAKQTDKNSGVVPGAGIYSENALNCSVSYWVAAITNMIINEDIKAVNISMGYNSYIPISASLGDAGAIEYVESSNAFFEEVLTKILENGSEFLICISAGNESGKSLYKVDSPYFGYGEKAILGKIDIFGIFDSSHEYCDSAYSLYFSSIENPEIKDRIMVVTAHNSASAVAKYSSLGDRVDISAPGVDIHSTGYFYEYEFMSGTSMAAPFVTATAGILFELDDSLTGKDVKNAIIDSATTSVEAKDFTYPQLDIYAAVKYILTR